MYVFSVFKNLFKVSNIGTIIFFLLNASLIIGLFGSAYPEALTQIIILYVISVLIALSPIGEWVLGFMAGARKMTRADMRNRMAPIVARVHRKALEKTPDMTKVINLKISYDPSPNAFALGLHTVCVTEGLFDLPDDQIEGIIAHELGHLALHHTDILLLIGGGNFIISGVLFIANFVSHLLTVIGALFSLSRSESTRGCGCFISIVGLIASLLVMIWTKFCMLFLKWSSRANEYAADKYAMEIGFGYELAHALDCLPPSPPHNSLIKALNASHPQIHDRIGRLQSLGVPYSRY